MNVHVLHQISTPMWSGFHFFQEYIAHAKVSHEINQQHQGVNINFY